MIIALIALGVLVLAIAAARSARARRLVRLRERWGRPVVRERKLDAIDECYRSRLSHAGSGASLLDDRTWRDLDMDDVFAVLDRTESTLGQHALYHRLHTAPDPRQLDAFEALVTRFEQDAPARERAQLALSRLQDPHGYDLWWLGTPDAVETRPWFVLFPLLTVATLALFALSPAWPQLTPLLVILLITNLTIRHLTDRRVGAAAAAFRQIAPVLATGELLAFVARDDNEAAAGALRTETKPLRRLKGISRWVSGDPFMLPVSPSGPAILLNDVVSVFYEYLNLGLLLDANGVFFGAQELRARGPALLRVVDAIGEVDAALSVASVRAGRSDWTRPRFTPPGAAAVLSGLRHPLLEAPVPNAIALDPGHGALVTGSNMSGKSTFVRTVGVAAVMAQTLNTCLADAYEAPVLKVRSCIGMADSLLTGTSYYLAEVQALLDLVAASAAAAPHLFLLDELFRGTNAVERIAAGQAVLRELVASGGMQKPHMVIAATHDGELVDLLAGLYRPFHFTDTVTDEGLSFDHTLKEGRAVTRNAIALLRLHGAPASLIESALACAADVDRQRGNTEHGNHSQHRKTQI